MGATYFYRDLQTLEMIVTKIIPEIADLDEITIWSAGCSSGPEPYTLALLLRENLSDSLFSKIRIIATDIDPNNRFEERIGKGTYERELLYRIPPEILSRHFNSDHENPGLMTISDEIRRCVVFKLHDLLTFAPVKENVNVIICKNVLLHFKDDEKNSVLKMFHRALAKDGFLVSEHTQKIPPEMSAYYEQYIPNVQIHRKVTF